MVVVGTVTVEVKVTLLVDVQSVSPPGRAWTTPDVAARMERAAIATRLNMLGDKARKED